MFVGEKVTLRGVTREDLPVLLSYYNDPEVDLAAGDLPSPTSMERLEKWYERLIEQQPMRRFAIEADGRFIGTCLLQDIDETAGHAELGITIGDKDSWGRGYGRDAIRVLLDYAFRLANLRRVWLRTHAENGRAIRAYQAVGFVEEGRLREHQWLAGRYVDTVLMGILRSEFCDRRDRNPTGATRAPRQSR
ncbi:GNAT family protein [Actinopolymorpha sp. B11F2]|uniref:GNAT family N-acetyltransferase n=1 Tax=Actinopolymorpha sp. B11F2 TaxID=3160862 RepID=UPI0032E44B6A